VAAGGRSSDRGQARWGRGAGATSDRGCRGQHKSNTSPGPGGAQLTSSYLADLRRRLPAGIVDEIAGGLAEAREHHLARGFTD